MNIIDDLVGMEEISEKYYIPLSTLYKFRSDENMEFPKRIKIANKNRLAVFDKDEIHEWYQNIYLKYRKIQEKYGHEDIVNELLNELLV